MDNSFLVKGRLMTLAGPAHPRTGAEMRDLGEVERGAMLVAEGSIRWVGPASLAPSSTSVMDFGDRIITPGLVDAHTHPIFGGQRANEFEQRSQGTTYQAIAATGGGIQSTMRATRAASEDELVETGKKHAQWFLSNGTTTIEGKSGYGLSLEDEIKILRAIRRMGEETPITVVPTFLGAHSYPPEFAKNQTAYVDLVCGPMLEQVAKEGLAEYVDAFCEERYFDAPASERILTRGKELGLGIRLHADQLTKCGGAELASKLGAKTADHLEQTDTEGIRALKKGGVQPVVLPASVYCLGLNHYPNARAMIDEGLALVLASDFNPGSSPTPSLPFVMSLACIQMKITPAEALTACTINAAYSLDRGDDRGSLESGKRADFVVWDCGDYREIAYWVGAQLADAVFVNGSQVFP
jgi:imidazolonepropionase